MTDKAIITFANKISLLGGNPGAIVHAVLEGAVQIQGPNGGLNVQAGSNGASVTAQKGPMTVTVQGGPRPGSV